MSSTTSTFFPSSAARSPPVICTLPVELTPSYDFTFAVMRQRLCECGGVISQEAASASGSRHEQRHRCLRKSHHIIMAPTERQFVPAQSNPRISRPEPGYVISTGVALDQTNAMGQSFPAKLCHNHPCDASTDDRLKQRPSKERRFSASCRLHSITNMCEVYLRPTCPPRRF